LQHNFNAIFPESLVVSFEAALEALSTLVVRQADNEQIEEKTDKSAHGQVVK
jgi:hypothetical protein